MGTLNSPITALEHAAGDGGAGVTSDDGVGGTGGKAEPPGDEIPDDGSQDAREDDVEGDDVAIDKAFADGAGDLGAECEGGDEVEEGGPGNGL